MQEVLCSCRHFWAQEPEGLEKSKHKSEEGAAHKTEALELAATARAPVGAGFPDQCFSALS